MRRRRTPQTDGVLAAGGAVYGRSVATDRARARCGERLELLAESTQDSVSLRREAIAELKRVIGFDRWCVPLMDPDTLISHTGVAETDHLADLDRLQLLDARLNEANNGYSVARRRSHVGLLSATTRGDLARSRRWRETVSATAIWSNTCPRSVESPRKTTCTGSPSPADAKSISSRIRWQSATAAATSTARELVCR